MDPPSNRGQKSKPLRPQEDNAQPKKRRRVVTATEKRAAVLRKMLQQQANKIAPAEKDSSSDDEDDVPLNQRRAVTQYIPSPMRDVRPTIEERAPSRELSPIPIDPPSSPVDPQTPPSTLQLSRSPSPERPVVRQSRERDEDSFEKRGEAILKKLSTFVDDILERLDGSNDSDDKYEVLTKDDPPLLQLSVMQRFTLLTLKAKQYQVIDKVDAPKLAQIIRSMEQHCVLAVDFDVISEFAQVREQKGNYTGIVRLLDRIVNGFEAAAMIFDIYSVFRIDKQYLPENLLLTCMQFIRTQLDNTIYPLIDLNGFEEDVTSLNNDARAFLRFVETTPVAKSHMARMLPLVTHLFRRVDTLLSVEGVDDHGIIVLCYIALGAFFHDYTDDNRSCLVENPGAGDTIINPFEQMKMGALDVLRLLFNKYSQHRKWILSEILTSLNSLTTMDRTVKRYRLRDSTAIHVMSALLMQLVQCCTVTGDTEDHKQWLRKWEMRYQKAQKDDDSTQLQELRQKLAQKATSYWKAGIDAATESATYLLDYLISKCRSRKRDSYSVAEYRTILESTLKDVLLVLGKPDWPAAELLMQVFSSILISKLQGKKSDLYLKSLAVDWLGIIAGRIKAGINSISGRGAKLTPTWLCELHERLPMDVNKTTSPQAIELLYQCQLKLYEHIDHGDHSALQFHLCAWGSGYISCWSKASTHSEEWPCEIQHALQINMGRVLYLSVASTRFPDENARESAFEFPELNWGDATLLSELLLSRNTLYKSFNMFLAEIMECLHSEVVTYRTKAVRAVRHIATDVPEILDEASIRVPIIQRIHDNSPSVRDATVEVLTKYLSRQTHVPRKLYEIVSTRIMDTAVNVRKRVVKLLCDLYFKCTDEELMVDIASKLILRVSDNEATISDLALKASQDVLFFPFQNIDRDEDDYFGSSYDHAPKARKERIKRLTKVITGAVARMEDGKATALSQIIQKTMDTCSDKQRVWFKKIFQWIIDCMFHSMMAHDEAGETKLFMDCLVTAHAFIKICPGLLRETQMSALQPYLSVSEQDDWILARHVLNIYEDVLPRIKYHDPDFIALLERVLVQLVGISPPEVTASTVSCLCVIVSRISHRYGILIRILGSCIVKLRGEQRAIQGNGAPSRAANSITKMLVICGLLCRHFDFDSKRNQSPEKMRALEKITEGSIASEVFDLIYWYCDSRNITNNTAVRLAALQGLGYLFMRYPTLATSEKSIRLMDYIFEHEPVSMQTRLMKVYQEFLATEEDRLERNEEAFGASLFDKEIDVDILLGNTAEFAELGVNGALMQRYLGKVLHCSMDGSSELRYTAYEVVSVIIRQGLAHPVLCMPTVFAAETSPESSLRHNAYYLHRFAHDKYGAMLYTHFPQYFLKAYQYQRLHTGGCTNGYRVSGGDTKYDALFGLAFSIIKQKKKAKMDFLSSLLKPFKFDMKETSADDLDVHYLRFLADNIITLDLTQSDEVFLLLYQINRIQATSCADLVAYIEFLRKGPSESQTGDIVAAKSAVAMYILLRIKGFLKDSYEVSDNDIVDFDPNENRKPRTISKSVETEHVIEWGEELQFFEANELNHDTVSDAYGQFEFLAMSTAAEEGQE
ncbi:sister chromatid cohesion C-terminus-domain-containing protein [Fennellomyces sp. T-0311]|nr:sister chromatid cohesion C-terminus-domain-containing protein [Fennellomyces sp. T-0311]